VSIIHRGAARGALIAGAAALVLAPGNAHAQTQTSGALEGSHVFCTAGCNVYGGQVNTDGTGAAWVVLMDSATAPGTIVATGCTIATSPRPCIMKWYQMSVSSVLSIVNFFGFNGSNRLGTKAGFVAVCSSTGPFTITPTAHCLFSFETLPN
jgi:hypothetical protein